MIEELARHGYRVNPGTLYPLLHRMEQIGYLKSSEVRNGKSLRKVYRATPLGRHALAAAKEKVRELFHELSKTCNACHVCAAPRALRVRWQRVELHHCSFPGGAYVRLPSCKPGSNPGRRHLPLRTAHAQVLQGVGTSRKHELRKGVENIRALAGSFASFRYH
jgi:DNA-binding MarR family transcriptional regulator